MSGLIVILYTTAGGIIGAGLTQYITHIRDRRSARALVIERLSETEEAYIALRWPLADESPYSHSRVAKLLGSLEAAALIAGVPRAILICYVISCQYYEDAHRLSRGAGILSEKVAAKVTDNIQAIRAHSDLPEIKESLSIISENIQNIHAKVKESDKHAFTLHDESLMLLGKALWHPIAFQLRRRRLRGLQNSAGSLEGNGRKMTDLLRQMESFYAQASSGSFLRSQKDSVSGRPAAVPDVANEPKS